MDSKESAFYLLLVVRKRCGLILLRGKNSTEVWMNTESNFESSQDMHIREEKYESNNRVRARQVVAYSLL